VLAEVDVKPLGARPQSLLGEIENIGLENLPTKKVGETIGFVVLGPTWTSVAGPSHAIRTVTTDHERGIEMKKAFKASRLIGLLALALGLMGVSATAAQAEPGAYWEVNGTKILTGSTLLPEIQAKNDTEESILLTTVGTSKVEILCKPIKFVGAKLHELGRATGKIHYEECITKLNGTAASRCTPKSVGAPLGLIETNALEGLIKLHELAGGAKDDLVKLSPVVNLIFVTLELGTLCAIGNKFDITGHITLKDCKNEGLVNKVEHLFEEGPLNELLFGGNAATIDGSAWAFLVGEHKGMVWSGHPN
jgi:hypothetical protein